MAEKQYTVEGGRLKYRKVADKGWDAHWVKHGLLHVFDTWGEAHAFLLVKCQADLKKAKSALKYAEGRLARVKAMPAPGEAQG